MSPYDNSRPRTDRTGGAPKAGSKSPKHRGHRADEVGAPAAKKRWDASERADRGRREFGTRDGGGNRAPGAARSEDRRPNWEPREKPAGGNRFGNRDFDSRNGERGRDAAPRFGRDGGREAARGYGRDGGRDAARGSDRGPRSWDRSDRPARDDRAPRSDDRGPRSYDRSDRPARDDRAPRSYDRSDRPARDDRAPRSYDRSDRPARDDRAPRSYDRDARPARDDRSRDDRPQRSYGDRPERGGRASGGFDRDARPARSFDRSDRPARDDRAPRSFDRNDRGDRPARVGDRSSDFYPKRDAATHYSPEDDVKLEKLKAEVVTAADVEGVSFGDLGLGDNIERQLASMGAAAPFAIQAATIPDVLAGRDVLGRGRTGSGKTIAFGAPLVEKLMENNGAKNRKMGRKPRALILAPTRELAMQIDRTVQPIARSVGLFTTQVYGGVPQQRQVGALNRGVDIVIGTPGRIEDLIDQGRLDLSEVVVTVLDEADHMCDLGFLEPVQRIIRETATVRPDGARAQKLLFSATLDKGVAKLVDEFLVDPAVHEVAGEDQASATIDHRVLLIEQRDKTAVIEQLASGGGKTLVFARTRAFAEQLADQLEDAGIRSTSLHGDLNQARRTRNLQLLTSGKVNVLVATDVAARGIHVDDIELVVQADMPDEYKTYMHRSGRTGRAGKEGTVVTLITRQRRRRMEELLDRAEIDAEMIEARSGDRLIDELAGVQA
ncbi:MULTISPECIES: DEAD/DEAH box helicase [unclassified Frigoribacterium]|uniref:DEAD/DEAH box helicase n=1 Tax=unclassified Frigoribacterium TaxID=2627005 RepID=UPI0006F21EFC|nr:MULTISPECIES: DEAD/DEAH box helicase [unclassified Frigoribacterium]KQO45388.1 RNA helicase [Frigoribacterium sp. Leaf254]KQT37090.1 RNA helicase [Frigoribacterium sp. Leaf415]